MVACESLRVVPDLLPRQPLRVTIEGIRDCGILLAAEQWGVHFFGLERL
jgi:hypothetical protein